MRNEIQKICLSLGEGGCYEFSLVKAAEVETTRAFDPIEVHARNRLNGWVDETCFVGNPPSIMSSLCGGTWVVLKAGNGLDSAGRPYDLPLDYVLKQGEHDIHRWERIEESVGTRVVKGHFTYGGPGLPFDPYGESLTRTKGVLVSRRILRRI